MEGKILVLFFLGFTVAFGHKYKPNWESLDSRPLPQVIQLAFKKGHQNWTIFTFLFDTFLISTELLTLTETEQSQDKTKYRRLDPDCENSKPDKKVQKPD